MLKTVLKNELRSIVRDPLYIFFAAFPFVLGTGGYFLVQYLEKSSQPPWPQVLAMFLVLMTGYVYGAITAFTLLDDKDDNVLMSLKITPIDVKMYVMVKLTITYLFGFIATLILIFATGFLSGSSVGTILTISLISALQGPIITLIVTSFSTNKVEGFVYMKMSAILLITPVLAFFYQTWQEVFFVIAPGFWSARLIQMELLPTIDTNFTFIVYFIGGVIYNILFVALFMKIYSKRSNL